MTVRSIDSSSGSAARPPRSGLSFAVLIVSGLLAGLGRTAAAAPAPAVPPPAAAPEAEASGDNTEGEAEEVTKRDITSPGNPYRPIVARNAFRLREPAPPPPPPTNAPAPPEPVKIDVKLAGLAKIKGVRYAYLMVPDSARPGQFLYPSLTDDPTRGRVRHGSGLEVREIDLAKQTVRVVNGGVEATLNFKEHGLKKDAVPSAAPGAKPGGIPAPGAPPMPGAVTPLNRAAASTTVFPAGGGSLPQPTPASAQPAANEPMVFSRNAARANAANAGVTGGNAFTPVVGNVGNVGGNVGGNVTVNPTVPNRTVRTDASVLNIPSVPVEQQYDLLIRQRQAAESVGIRLPPIPGMPVDPSPVQPQ